MKTTTTPAVQINETSTVIGYNSEDRTFIVRTSNLSKSFYIMIYSKSEMMEVYGLSYSMIDKIIESLNSA
jgi:hypothetical protein